MSKRGALSGNHKLGAARSLWRNPSYRLAQAPERASAIVLGCGAVDADIAQHSRVEAREQPSVAATLIPGDGAFDQSDQRASKDDAKPGSAAH